MTVWPSDEELPDCGPRDESPSFKGNIEDELASGDSRRAVLSPGAEVLLKLLESDPLIFDSYPPPIRSRIRWPPLDT